MPITKYKDIFSFCKGPNGPNIEPENKPGVYYIYHIPTLVFYIGSTSDLRRRLGQHLGELKRNVHHNKRLQDLYNKNSHLIMEYVETETTEKAIELEQEALNRDHGQKLCCNIDKWALGFEPGRIVTDEIRNKIKTTLNKEEIKEKIKINAAIARSTEQFKINRSRASKLLWNDPTYREKIIKSSTGRHHNEETKKKLSELRSKKVSINNVIYNSLIDAGNALGIDRTTVGKKIINDKTNMWKYL